MSINDSKYLSASVGVLDSPDPQMRSVKDQKMNTVFNPNNKTVENYTTGVVGSGDYYGQRSSRDQSMQKMFDARNQPGYSLFTTGSCPGSR